MRKRVPREYQELFCVGELTEMEKRLYIELKRRDGGRVSTEQTAWMEALARQGYKTALCHGWDAAREEIQRYLGGVWS